MCKQCFVKRREYQHRSNRRRKLSKSVLIAGSFMWLLLKVRTTQLLSRSISLSCMKHEVLFLINRKQIRTLHPSSYAFHCRRSEWYEGHDRVLVKFERNLNSESAEISHGRRENDVVRFCLLNYEQLYFIL